MTPDEATRVGFKVQFLGPVAFYGKQAADRSQKSCFATRGEPRGAGAARLHADAVCDVRG